MMAVVVLTTPCQMALLGSVMVYPSIPVVQPMVIVEMKKDIAIVKLVKTTDHPMLHLVKSKLSQN